MAEVAIRRFLSLLVFLLVVLLTRESLGDGAFSYFEIHCRRKPWKWNTIASVPKDGIYFFSLRADPGGGTKNATLVLKRNGTPMFSAVAEGLPSSASVAAPVKAGDDLEVVGLCKDEATVSAAFVSPLNGVYSTVMAKAVSHGQNTLVKFNSVLTLNGWEDDADTFTTLTVPTTGIYWVAARPVPGVGTTVVHVINGDTRLLTIHGETTPYLSTGKAVSTSAAFYLTALSTLALKLKSKYRYTTAGTMLSFVHLVGNQKPNTGNHRHIAFTGTPRATREYPRKSNVAFDNAVTNHGSLYSNRQIRIPVDGVYLISLRPDPKPAWPLDLKLHINSNPAPTWIAYSVLVQSGQSVALRLERNNVLVVKTGGRVETHSLWSVAFVQP